MVGLITTEPPTIMHQRRLEKHGSGVVVCTTASALANQASPRPTDDCQSIAILTDHTVQQLQPRMQIPAWMCNVERVATRKPRVLTPYSELLS